MKAVYLAREECYVYLYISNENATLVDVYFDDVVMTHKRSRLIQGSEYYPYGMQTANSWTREDNPENNFLANGGTELNTTTQVYDLYYRNYDPQLGRFGQVDPVASQFANFAPYSYGFNDPVFYNDRLGNCPDCECAVCDPPNLFPPGSLPTRRYEGGALTPRDICEWEALQSFAQQSFSKSYAGAQTSGGWAGIYGLVRGLFFDNRIASEVTAKADAMGQASSLGVELDYNKHGEWGWWEDGGNTLEYTFDKNGNLVIIQRPIAKSNFHRLGSKQKQSKDPYDGHSISFGGNVALGGGVNFGFGFVWSNEGDARFFIYGGPSAGFDASAGVAIKGIKTKDGKPFDPNRYGGWSSSHNVGVGIIDVSLIGGDNDPNEFTGAMGASYFESGGGLSLSGIPVAYTYQMTNTFFPGDWFN